MISHFTQGRLNRNLLNANEIPPCLLLVGSRSWSYNPLSWSWGGETHPVTQATTCRGRSPSYVSAPGGGVVKLFCTRILAPLELLWSGRYAKYNSKLHDSFGYWKYLSFRCVILVGGVWNCIFSRKEGSIGFFKYFYKKYYIFRIQFDDL